MKDKKRGNGSTAVDPRFAAARTDPRFQRFPKSQRKVEIDERFAEIFKDKAFQVRSAVDKRGRKIAKAKQKEDMRKYYKIQGDEGGKAVGAIGSEDKDHADLTEGKEQEHPRKKQRLAVKGSQLADGKTAKPAGADVVKPSKRQDVGKGLDLLATANKAQKHKKVQKADNESDDLSEDEEDEEAKKAAERWARVRGLTGPDSSSASSFEDDSEMEGSAEGSESSAEEDIDLSEWGIGAMAGNPDEEVPEVADETSRLAILDLDWTKVRAVDIFAMLQSFLKKGQRLKKVTVYPSDYGLERMKEEARFGPQGLSSSKLGLPASESGDGKENGKQGDTLSKEQRAAVLEALNEEESDEEEDAGGTEEEDASDEEASDVDGDANAAAQLEEDSLAEESKSESEGDGDDDVARRRLQLYERSRLRYYYAIAECADVASAKQLYTECDGMEFEHSANLFDLRYVPDSEDFGGREPREVATQVPSGYKPPEVGAVAMLHTKPKLTWDAEDEGRKRMLHKRVSKDELRDDDFKAYLGSESEEDELLEQQKLSSSDRYRQLLTGAATAGKTNAELDKDVSDSDTEGKDDNNDKEQQDQVMEMEVTFGGGLDDLSARLKAKAEERVNQKNDTVWQAYLRKRDERRKRAKARGQKVDEDDDAPSGDDSAAEQDPFFKHEDTAFDDPFFKDANGAKGVDVGGKPKEKKQKKQSTRQEEAAAAEAEKQRQAQLELLLMDDRALQDAVRLGAVANRKASGEEAAEEKPRQKLSKKARLAAKKAERRAKRGAASDDDDMQLDIEGAKFAVDVKDTRFGALFTSPDFALDPTDPRYKATEGAKSIQKEAMSRRETGTAQKQLSNGPGKKPHATVKGEKPKVSDNMKLLVASLKRRGAVQARKPQK